MKRLVALLAAAPLCLIGGVAAAPALLRTEKISTHWIKPSAFVDRMATPGALVLQGTSVFSPPAPLPEGVDGMSLDDAAMTLTVRGTAGSIAEVRSLLRFLDVPPRAVRLQVRLLRFRFPAGNGAPGVEALSTVTTRATNAVPVHLSAVGERRIFRMRVQPQINGDGSVMVHLEMQEPELGTTSLRRIPSGSRWLIPVENALPLTGRAVWKGATLPRTGASTGLYVEIVPTLLGGEAKSH